MGKKCVLVAALILAFVGCTPKDDNGGVSAPDTSKEILVGEFGSMTGDQATFGISTHRGLMLALEAVNSKGGINGKKIRVITVDDQSKPDQAATAVTKLITQDKVSAILGEVASSNTLAAAPIAQQYKIPLISPASTNPKVTGVGDYIFRVCFIDPFQGAVMAKFAYNNLHLRNVAILSDVKSDYSQGLGGAFKDTFTALGGKIAAEQSFARGDIDFKAQLTSIKSAQPDGIFVPAYYGDDSLIARQSKELGIKVPLMGGDGWDSAKLFEIGQDAVIGVYFSNHYSTDSGDPEVKQFIAAYKKAYKNETPDAMAALGYDAMKILADSLRRAKTLGSSDIRDSIAQTKDFAGVTGKISINGDRNATKSAVVVQVAGDHNKFVTTVNP